MIRVIIGLPGVGKSTYVEGLKASYPNASFLHTDDYKKGGRLAVTGRDDFDKSLEVIMEAIAADSNPEKIIEGVQGYRLLRKGLREKSFYADEVITCICDNETRIQRYRKREGKDITKGFDKTLIKFWTDYINELPKSPRQPELTIIKT